VARRLQLRAGTAQHAFAIDRVPQVGGALASVGKFVRASHERYDGTGYPDRIAGEQIPIEARIVAGCDAYNAMTTDRPYHAAISSTDGIAATPSRFRSPRRIVAH
jgi:two-component system cell cycle response regulator